MSRTIIITKGKAIVDETGLRCQSEYIDSRGAKQPCNKLLFKASSGQIAGFIRCGRCKQDVSAEMREI